MSATDLYLFPTMEDVVGDSMDMASPFPGHVDDFEIDIDVMEDGASNMDNDLEVADASPGASHSHNVAASAAPEDHVHDAEMIDETLEPDPTVHETFQHGGAEYYNADEHSLHPNEPTYESEMADEDFDEDIDAPIPESHESQVPLSTSDHVEFSADTVDVAQRQYDADGELVEDSLAANNEQGHLGTKESEGETKDSNGDEQSGDRNDLGFAFPIEDAATKNHSEDKEPSPSHGSGPNAGGLDSGTADLQSEVVPEDSVPSAHELDEPAHSPIQKREEPARFDSTHFSHYHPVKVFYQNNEISLFPPQEGDSSSTFLLEDAGLFYDSFSKILSSCRHVLGEDIIDEDILVVEVEQLNIQLNEDVASLSDVTLGQLVEIYLHLCSNEGIHQPEPLFLSLSTKPSILTKVSVLRKAAEAGKGISTYYSWSSGDFPDQQHEEGTEVGDNEGDWKQPHIQHDTEEGHLEKIEPDSTDTINADQKLFATDARQIASTNDQNNEQDDQVKDVDELHVLPFEHVEDPNSINENGIDKQTKETDFQSHQSIPGSLQLDESHAVEEQTESSITIAAESLNEPHGSRDTLSDQAEDEGIEKSTEEHIEEGSHEDHEREDSYEELGDDGSLNEENYDGESVENLIPNEEVDIHATSSQSASAFALEMTNYTEEQDIADYSRSETDADPLHAETSHLVEVGTPAITDDLLGVDEDFFKSPEKKPGDSTGAAYDNASQLAEHQEFQPSFDESGHDPEELHFDHDYFEAEEEEENADDEPSDEYTGVDELDVGEAGYDADEVKFPESGSGKRSREIDNDPDAIQAASPETKRSRAS